MHLPACLPRLLVPPPPACWSCACTFNLKTALRRAVQAYKDANLSAIVVQYTIIGINLVIVLPISLGVDGTDWKAQFGGMDAKEWGALVFCGCLAHAWIAILIQVRPAPRALVQEPTHSMDIQ